MPCPSRNEDFCPQFEQKKRLPLNESSRRDHGENFTLLHLSPFFRTLAPIHASVFSF